SIEHLRQSSSDPRPPQPPAPLAEWNEDTMPDTDTRAWGGPKYAALDEHLARFAGGAGTVDIAAAFGAAPEEIRRPVDLLGLLELAHRTGMTETESVVTIEAIRPDRTRRRFALGGVVAANAEAADE